MTEPPNLWFGINPGTQATIRAICGWHIAPVITETVTLDGSGGSVQLFPTLALRKITALTVNGQVIAQDVLDNLEISRRGMARGVHWGNRYSGVVATIEHGFELTPADLRSVASRIETMARLFASGGGSVRIGQVQVSPGSGGQMQTGHDGLDVQTQRLLAPYILNWGS